MFNDDQDLSAPATKGDLNRFATKDDLLLLKEELRRFATKDDLRLLKEDLRRFATKDDLLILQDDMNARFVDQEKTMTNQFNFVADLIKTMTEDIKKENRESLEHIRQELYNKTTDQDVIIATQGRRLKTVENRLGIAA